MADLFYGQPLDTKHFVLENEEFHHCIKVTRHKIGDSILVTDFAGSIFNAHIDQIQSNSALLTVTGLYKEESADAPQLQIAISPTHQSERFEWCVEKAVEAGVHKIIPMFCDRTETRRIRKERLDRIIFAAAKQTLRPLKPELTDATTFNQLIEDLTLPAQKFIAHCNETDKRYLGSSFKPTGAAIIFIGPAGDFSEREINQAIQKKFIPVSLGSYRLRTETAGLVALQIFQTVRSL